MKNVALVISHKNSVHSDYFYNTICKHKNIQKINIQNYDKIEKLLQTKTIRNDYLKNPKFFCEKLIYNHQLSFKPFLDYFFYFFIIEKPRNIIKNKDDSIHYCFRLRRIYELISKVKNKIILIDNDIYKKETYDKCFEFLGLKTISNEINKKFHEDLEKGIYDEDAENLYEKYRYKIINNFIIR